MKVAMLLSGGVDSSVAMSLLRRAGHDVTAFYLKIWLQDEFAFLGDCPWEEDLHYARGVCERLEIPLEIVPMQDEYWNSIIRYTIDEIRAGRTPNPDRLCNNMVKFGQFFDKIDAGYEKVATGHYANVVERDGLARLHRTPDEIKDQTYFLARLNQAQLARALFPLGELRKAQVRELAREFDLPTQNRRDSQGLCFLGQIRFSDFVREHLGVLKGEIVDADSGEVLGEHDGYYYYTIGQRQGLGLSGGPWYVVGKDIPGNRVLISRQNRMADKYRDTFPVGAFSWLSGAAPAGERFQVKVRHGARIYDCALTMDGDDHGVVRMDEVDRAGIASGQFAVFYDGLECLGSAMILDG